MDLIFMVEGTHENFNTTKIYAYNIMVIVLYMCNIPTCITLTSRMLNIVGEQEQTNMQFYTFTSMAISNALPSMAESVFSFCKEDVIEFTFTCTCRTQRTHTDVQTAY